MSEQFLGASNAMIASMCRNVLEKNEMGIMTRSQLESCSSKECAWDVQVAKPAVSAARKETVSKANAQPHRRHLAFHEAPFQLKNSPDGPGINQGYSEDQHYVGDNETMIDYWLWRSAYVRHAKRWPR
jgi:hypothetical protein